MVQLTTRMNPHESTFYFCIKPSLKDHKIVFQLQKLVDRVCIATLVVHAKKMHLDDKIKENKIDYVLILLWCQLCEIFFVFFYTN